MSSRTPSIGGAGEVNSDRIPEVEVIVDSRQAQFTGTWKTSSFQKNSYSQNYRFTNRADYSSAPRVAVWRPTVPGPGDYTVSIWLPDGGSDRSPAVKYRLHHAGQVSEFLVDQTTLGGRWRQLGRGPYRFSGSGEEYLELRVADVAVAEARPQDAALYVQADAVRFASPPPPLAAAPSSISATEAPNYVEISWKPLPGTDAFVVSRGVGEAAPTEMLELAGTTYLDLDVRRDSVYTYEVAGVNGAGAGPSASVKATPTADAPLQSVQGLRIKTVGGIPVLSWQPTSDATAYLVQRSNKSDGHFATIARVNGTEFADFLAMVKSHYVVRSVNAHGECALTSWQVTWQR